MLNTQRPTKADTTPPAAPRPAAVQLRARRSPKMVALGILMVALGGLTAAFLFTLNSDHHPVLTLTDDVRRGQEIAREHLSVVEVPSGLGVDALPADQLESVVGERALFDLPRGSFPLARHLGEDPLPEGEALVGLRLAPGRLPAGELPPGTSVRLISLAEADDRVANATVASTPVPLEDGTFTVDVRVLDEEADAIARLSAADLIALVVQEEG